MLNPHPIYRYLCGSLLLLSVQVQAQSIELTLADTIALALKQNYTVENTYLNRILEKLDLRIAEDAFSPKYSVGSSVGYNSAYDNDVGRNNAHRYGTNANISLALPTGGQLALTAAHDASLSDSASYSDNLSLSLSQPLLKGAGHTVGTASLVMARRQEQSNLLTLKDTLSNLVSEVIKQYRSYMSAERELEISRLSLARSKKQLEMTQELILSGRIPAVELVQSQTDVANQQLSLRSTENSIDAARINLLRLLRLPPETQIIPTEVLEVAQYNQVLAELEKTAFQQRSDYQQAKLSLENSKLNLVLAKNEKLWDLSLETSYGIGRSNNNAQPLHGLRSPEKGDFQVGLQLTVPLWDLETKRRVVSAKIALKQARTALKQLEESIVLELLNAHRDLQIRWEQLGLNKQTLALSRKQLSLEQEKLKMGRSSSFQVVSFQNSLVEAESSYLNAQIDYLNALTDLDQLLGTTLQHWGISLDKVEQQHISKQGWIRDAD